MSTIDRTTINGQRLAEIRAEWDGPNSLAKGKLRPANDRTPERPDLDEADDIFSPLPDVPYLIESLDMCVGRPVLWAGYGYVGKTPTLQSLAVSVATGRDVWGMFKATSGRVIHLDWDQGTRLTRERYQRLAAGMGVDVRELQGKLAHRSYPRFTLDRPGAEDWLARLTEKGSLCILDALHPAAPSIEENSPQMSEPLYLAARVSEKTGCTIVLIHHCGKPNKDRPGGARMAIRGSSAIYSASGSVFVLEADKGEPVRVMHERTQTIGTPAADFGLRIEDVPDVRVRIGTKDKPGLRVVHLDRAQIAANGEAQDTAEAIDKVRQFFRQREGRPYEGNMSELRSMVGIGLGALTDAMARMKDTGEVQQGGTYHKRTWTWKGQ